MSKKYDIKEGRYKRSRNVLLINYLISNTSRYVVLSCIKIELKRKYIL